jgi:hypothetical protein
VIPAVAETRVVQQSEHLSSISAEEGFADFHTILDHSDNADLAGKRDPHVLYPGDQLTIPDREDRTETGATDNVYTYQTDLRPLYLRCDVLDINGDPISAANCNIKTQSGDVLDVVTNGKGTLQQTIGRQDKAVTITVHLPPPKTPPPCPGDPPPDAAPDPPPEDIVEFDVKIGNLNPETKASGQQARLNNLGYFAGFTVKDLDQLLWAAEEFECDNITKPVKKRPEIAAAPPTGEDDPANADPDSKTGIQDATIVGKLKTVHGI